MTITLGKRLTITSESYGSIDPRFSVVFATTSTRRHTPSARETLAGWEDSADGDSIRAGIRAKCPCPREARG